MQLAALIPALIDASFQIVPVKHIFLLGMHNLKLPLIDALAKNTSIFLLHHGLQPISLPLFHGVLLVTFAVLVLFPPSLLLGRHAQSHLL